MSQQEQQNKSQYVYRASTKEFINVPGKPIAYWTNKRIIELFQGELISSMFFSEGPSKTGNDEKYLRFHWEVSRNDIGEDKLYSLCSKGGEYRKYYGNIEHVIRWDRETKEHYRKDKISRITAEHVWASEGITWSIICSNSGYGFRLLPCNSQFNSVSPTIFPFEEDPVNLRKMLVYLNSSLISEILNGLNPTLALNVGNVLTLPCARSAIDNLDYERIFEISSVDWCSKEEAFDFSNLSIISKVGFGFLSVFLKNYFFESIDCAKCVKGLEEFNNKIIINAFSLQGVVSPEVPLEKVTLSNNPYYNYGEASSVAQLESFFQCDSTIYLMSYIIGCMMGRYSIDKPGLILASQGETLQDYLNQIPNPRFMPDSDAILPLTDQEWFADDVTNRVREFVKVVWGEETLQENLAFIAESLCLHAIKPKKSEGALDTIRRYLSTQFYKDHLKTYKKRPIYWLFSSGKEKAFECLVYLHRYNESTLARMRTEYVTPLMGKYDAQHSLLLEQKTDASPAQQRELEKEIKALEKKQTELRAFDEQLKHYADMRIKLDLDDGVKVNYGKFGNLLAEVKAVTGDKGE